MAAESFSVIREAMRAEGQIALGRVVLSTRERLMALEPRGRGIIAYSLRSRDEVRDPADLFDDIPEIKIDPAMVDIARKIIEQQEGPFDPSQFADRYEDALKRLIAQKEKGRRPVAVAEPEDTNVVDLMAALRASLEGARRPAKPSASRRAPAKKPASRRSPPKRRAAG